jgi:tRNA pseudouridine55 synthase
VVAIVRRLAGKGVKVGHTGTLDPQAEGVLPICVGRATKLSDFLMGTDKSYRAELVLGKVTDTGDETGKVLKNEPVHIGLDEVIRAVQPFIGGYGQIPPMYSAVKINGKKLYELARVGKDTERKPRRVEIYDIRVSHENGLFTLSVDCGKGTYIRSLCMDIGEALGCGACMGSLIRTRSGRFTVQDAVPLDTLKNGIPPFLIPLEEAFHAKKAILNSVYFIQALNGHPVPFNWLSGVSDFNENEYIWLFATENKTPIGLYKAENGILGLEVLCHGTGADGR